MDRWLRGYVPTVVLALTFVAVVGPAFAQVPPPRFHRAVQINL